MIGRVIVEGDVAGRIVEMYGRYYKMGDWNDVGGFRDKGQEGDEAIIPMVGLVVADYARTVSWLWWDNRERHSLKFWG